MVSKALVRLDVMTRDGLVDEENVKVIALEKGKRRLETVEYGFVALHQIVVPNFAHNVQARARICRGGDPLLEGLANLSLVSVETCRIEGPVADG